MVFSWAACLRETHRSPGCLPVGRSATIFLPMLLPLRRQKTCPQSSRDSRFYLADASTSFFTFDRNFFSK
jgi:hypothetical protein